MYPKRYRWVVCLLVSTLLCFSWVGGNTEVMASSGQISLDVRKADLRDVLSLLALKTNTNIVLIEEPTKITFSVENVSPMKALELLLQTIGMDYVQDGNLLIVGTPAKLQRGFAETTLTRFDLVYIKTEQFEPLLYILDLPVTSFVLEGNPYVIWVEGTPQELVKVKELLAAVDQKENAVFDGSGPLPLDYRDVTVYAVEPSRLAQLIQQVGIPLERYLIMGNRLLIFDRAIIEQWDEFYRVISELDQIDARRSSVFPFRLNNIVAQDAAQRLSAFGYPDVRVITFNFPELSRELIVICPPELESQVYTSLVTLDVAPEKIKATVTTATGPTARRELQAKRSLLAEMTSVSLSDMYISDNLSGDASNPHYILWAHETPDRIKMLQDLVESFD
jgi:type IV pilus assembly protein PilQ